MRKIELKVFKMGSYGGAQLPDLDVGDMLVQILAIRSEGVTVREMHQSLSVMNAISAAKAAKQDHILLETAVWEHLRERLAAHKFGVVDPAIVQMFQLVDLAPEVSVKAT